MLSRRELFSSWEVLAWNWKKDHANVIKSNSNIPCTWYIYVSFLFWWMDCGVLLDWKVSSSLLLLFLPANYVMRLIELSLIQIPSIIWSPIAWVWKSMWKLKLSSRRDFGLGCLCYGGNPWAAPQLCLAVRNWCQAGSEIFRSVSLGGANSLSVKTFSLKQFGFSLYDLSQNLDSEVSIHKQWCWRKHQCHPASEESSCYPPDSLGLAHVSSEVGFSKLDMVLHLWVQWKDYVTLLADKYL